MASTVSTTNTSFAGFGARSATARAAPKRWRRAPSGNSIRSSPRAGFRDRADYYARCSCGPHLVGIGIPTVILTAGDDPFAPGGDVARFPRNSAVHLHMEATGGHMGYMSRAVPGYRWLDHALDHYLGALTDLLRPAMMERPGQAAPKG